ncbi:hypothetical protein M501DRAFT_732911 [Patellaria atrata CBS 101060]|uniref:Uncharacterized protein n=1 Tax=Patellaria atrata CBS 101060 TaxID=1346257 RepID=A0A9P4SCA6_9PEZI|nr:hypothetical protein M501DRAFT_732911 [Patellaria atrata CBS 101060]
MELLKGLTEEQRVSCRILYGFLENAIAIHHCNDLSDMDSDISDGMSDDWSAHLSSHDFSCVSGKWSYSYLGVDEEGSDFPRIYNQAWWGLVIRRPIGFMVATVERPEAQHLGELSHGHMGSQVFSGSYPQPFIVVEAARTVVDGITKSFVMPPWILEVVDEYTQLTYSRNMHQNE